MINKLLALSEVKQKQVLSRKIFMTENYYTSARENEYFGYCTRCKYEQEGCEPDAENYQCEECEENAVQGIDNLLISGEIRICENENDPLLKLAEKFRQRVYY